MIITHWLPIYFISQLAFYSRSLSTLVVAPPRPLKHDMQSLLSLAVALVGLSAAQSTTVSLFLPNTEHQDLVASVVGAVSDPASTRSSMALFSSTNNSPRIRQLQPTPCPVPQAPTPTIAATAAVRTLLKVPR